MSKKKVLGRGVNALFSSDDMKKFNSSISEKGELIMSIPLELIDLNPNQPRKHFDENTIGSLALSIQKVGLLQPISVFEEDGRYIIIAGERRFRAVKHLGHETIRSIVVNANERLVAELALIENLQREDLNPIDEASAYLSLTKNHDMTHEMISELVGKSRAHISNYIRLLSMTPEEQQALVDGLISVGHAKVLLSIKDPGLRAGVFSKIKNNSISVREAEVLAEKASSGNATADSVKETGGKKKTNDIDRKRVERRLEDRLGTKVRIKEKNGQAGSIVIDYYSAEDRERLLSVLFHVEQES